MIEKDEILICTECVNDIRFKLLIERTNTIGKCSCCGNEKQIIYVDSYEFIQMTKALLRYYYSEWDYNTHFGGDGYIPLIDNIFFNKENFKDKDVYEELLTRIEFFDVYEDYNKGVSIFAGEEKSLLAALKTDFDRSILKIEQALKNENYFNFEKKIIQILSSYKLDCKITIKQAQSFYRARIGFEDKKRDLIKLGLEGREIFVPYSNSKIGAPPPFHAGFGRINRTGVSYLYCASDKYTAISEIRPHPGDIVSIGKFIPQKELLIFDLTEAQFLNYYQTDEKLDNFRALNTMSELMQKVIPPSEREAYNITQLIADCIRQLNFEGILFPSSVGNGHNLVVFNPQNMKYINEDAGVVQISKVSYEYSPRD